MKKLHYLVLLFISVFVLSCSSSEKSDFEYSTSVPLADPFIMLHDDVYYAYGTNSDNGIEVYTSDDLKVWKKEPQLALNKKDSWADRWFWAPEVYYIKEKNKFFMYYSADEHICVATGDSPLGPFVQSVQKPMLEDEKCIDNTLFIDDDGKPYMYFDRFNDGLNIWVAELESDLETIKKETLTKCINVSQPWEEIWPRVNEGAFITKHKGLYYLTYSANSYESPFYGIGYATSSSPLGPWTKYDKNPILQKPDSLVGVGHSAMFTDKAGQLKIVFHAHRSPESIHPRDMYISDVTFTNDEVPVMKISGAILKPKLVIK
ncbi:MAG: glycoside hydrolase family 43 protein [Prevotella sp.]|jgi:beta-xylosidase|nr:glycoside hydrolase family 43 protein [Prevotella sp.]